MSDDIVRMPGAPPNALVVTFRRTFKKRPPVVLRTTVNRAPKMPGSERSDVWVASVAWDVNSGELVKVFVEIGAMESLVRLEDAEAPAASGVVSRPTCGALLTVEQLPPERGPYAVGVWQTMWTAPRDRWINVLTKNGVIERVMWVDDLDFANEVQIKGWFKEMGDINGGREKVSGPFNGWRPVVALYQGEDERCAAR